MADKTWYAWGPIRYASTVDPKTGVADPRAHKHVKVGEEVTAEKLGIDKEEFGALVESGAIRSKPVPDMPEGYQGSIVDFLRKQARDAEKAAVEGVSELMTNANEPPVTNKPDDTPPPPPVTNV